MRCIIAEDNILIRHMDVMYLEKEGFDVLAETSDGEETLDRVIEYKPDIVFLDINMAYRTDGIDCAKKINNKYSKTKIIFMSAYPQDTFDKELRGVSFLKYIDKPLTQNKLKRCFS